MGMPATHTQAEAEDVSSPEIQEFDPILTLDKCYLDSIMESDPEKRKDLEVRDFAIHGPCLLANKGMIYCKVMFADTSLDLSTLL